MANKKKKPPFVVIIEGEVFMRNFYSKRLHDHTHLMFITTISELEDFIDKTKFKDKDISCIVTDAYLEEEDKFTFLFLGQIRGLGYEGPIIAASDSYNHVLVAHGAKLRPLGDKKENVPALVLEILDL